MHNWTIAVTVVGLLTLATVFYTKFVLELIGDPVISDEPDA